MKLYVCLLCALCQHCGVCISNSYTAITLLSMLQRPNICYKLRIKPLGKHKYAQHLQRIKQARISPLFFAFTQPVNHGKVKKWDHQGVHQLRCFYTFVGSNFLTQQDKLFFKRRLMNPILEFENWIVAIGVLLRFLRQHALKKTNCILNMLCLCTHSKLEEAAQ
jgi:hypothetical protein